MRSPDWCFLDELETGDHFYDATTGGSVEIVDLALVRVPSGPCVWKVTTRRSVLHFAALAQVERVVPRTSLAA